MSKFAHLAGLVLEDTREGKRNKTKEEQLKDLKGNVIRLYKNGEVYPSQDLVNKFNLEYRNKNDERVAYGFDVVDSTEWKPTESLPRTIFVGIVNKALPKVDLFAGVRWNEQGEPISSVLTQGTKSFLLLSLARTMGWMTEDKAYVDLELQMNYPVKMIDGIAYIPKYVERGETKGERTYERRENVTFYPLDTVTVQVEQTTETAVETTAKEVLTKSN